MHRVRARADPGDSTEAGLAIRMDEKTHYAVFVRGGEIAVRARIGPLAHVIAAAALPAADVVLRLETHQDRVDPGHVRLGYEADGEFRVLAELDGRFGPAISVEDLPLTARNPRHDGGSAP